MSDRTELRQRLTKMMDRVHGRQFDRQDLIGEMSDWQHDAVSLGIVVSPAPYNPNEASVWILHALETWSGELTD